jgi:hypothetical protein
MTKSRSLHPLAMFTYFVSTPATTCSWMMITRLSLVRCSKLVDTAGYAHCLRGSIKDDNSPNLGTLCALRWCLELEFRSRPWSRSEWSSQTCAGLCMHDERRRRTDSRHKMHSLCTSAYVYSVTWHILEFLCCGFTCIPTGNSRWQASNPKFCIILSPENRTRTTQSSDRQICCTHRLWQRPFRRRHSGTSTSSPPWRRALSPTVPDTVVPDRCVFMVGRHTNTTKDRGMIPVLATNEPCDRRLPRKAPWLLTKHESIVIRQAEFFTCVQGELVIQTH